MKKALFAVFAFALFTAVGSAQTTTVSLNGITDSDGTVWNAGTWQIDFVVSPSEPNPEKYKNNGSHVSDDVLHQRGTLNASGVGSIVVYDNTLTTPLGSQWQLQVCPNASSSCSTFVFVASGPALDMTATVNAGITAPRFQGIAGNKGYADVEVLSPLAGSTYFNVVSSCQKTYSGSAWSCSGAAAYPGVTSNGANGLTVTGSVAAGAAVTAAGSPLAASQMTSSPVWSNGIKNFAWTHYDAFGDSLTQGVDATSCTPFTTATCYVGIVSRGLNLTGATTNHGVAGTTLVEAQNSILNSINNDTGTMDAVTIQIGTNDVTGKIAQGIATSPYEAVWSSMYEATIEYATIASSHKQTVSSFATNWTVDSTYSQIAGAKSTTNGAVQDFPTFTLPLGSEAMVFWYRVFNSNGGAFHWQLINANTSAVIIENDLTTQTGTTLYSPIDGLTSAVYSLMLPGYSVSEPAGTQLFFRFTVTSATSASNIVSILGTGFGPSYYLTNYQTNQPQVFVGDIPYQANGIYRGGVSQFSYDLQSVILKDQLAGLPVNFVATHNYLTGLNTNYFAGNSVHPNDSGYALLGAAYLAPTAMITQPPLATLTNATLVNPSVSGSVNDSAQYIDANANIIRTAPNAQGYLKAGTPTYLDGSKTSLGLPTAAGTFVTVGHGNGNVIRAALDWWYSTGAAATFYNQWQQSDNSNTGATVTPTAIQRLFACSSNGTCLPYNDTVTYPNGSTLTYSPGVTFKVPNITNSGCATAGLVTSTNTGVYGCSAALPSSTTATTQAPADNTTAVATDAFVQTAVGGGASTSFIRAFNNGLVENLLAINTALVGQGAMTTNCVSATAGSINVTATAPLLVSSTSGTSAANCAGWFSNGIFNYHFAAQPLITFGVAYSASTDFSTAARIWFALSSCSAATMEGSDSPAACNYAAIRSSTTAGDANYQCVTSDGSAQTVTSIGVAPTTSYTVMSINVGASTVTCTVAGTSVSNSTHLPQGASTAISSATNTITSGSAALHLRLSGWYGYYQNGAF